MEKFAIIVGNIEEYSLFTAGRCGIVGKEL